MNWMELGPLLPWVTGLRPDKHMHTTEDEHEELANANDS